MRGLFWSSLAALVLLAAAAAPVVAVPQSGRVPRFQLERASVTEGEPPTVKFERPLPAVAGEQYWITLVSAGQPDDAWGLWQYVADGAGEVVLQPAHAAGAYEVRLHDGYPRVGHNVVHRQALTVVSRSAPATARSDVSAAGAKGASTSIAAPAPSAAPQPRLTNSTGVLRGRKVSWEGARGDAEDLFAPPNWIIPDIVTVQAEGRAREVIITLVLESDLNRMLNQKMSTGAMKGYTLVDVYFDSDGDPTSGRELGMAPGRKGYDASVQIMTGLEFTSGSATMTQFGNISTIPGTHKVIGPRVTWSVENRSGTGGAGAGGGQESAEKQITIKGRTLVARVPYERLGLERGKTVRVCFFDHTMDLLDRGNVSCDAQLTLE